MDTNQHDTSISEPDYSAGVIAHPGQGNGIMPGPPFDAESCDGASGRRMSSHHRKQKGNACAWCGLRVLGAAFGMALVWFIAAWIRYGRVPLGLFSSRIPSGFDSSVSLILPPAWLVALLGVMVMISLIVMFTGSHSDR